MPLSGPRREQAAALIRRMAEELELARAVVEASIASGCCCICNTDWRACSLPEWHDEDCPVAAYRAWKEKNP